MIVAASAGMFGVTPDTRPRTEFQRLCTGRRWSVMAWEQPRAFWQCIDPAAGESQALAASLPGDS